MLGLPTRWSNPLVLAALLGGCADPPTATFEFAPFDDPDNCAASEAEIAAGTAAIWVGLRQDGAEEASTCVAIEGASDWGDLEQALSGEDLLLEDLPLDQALEGFVMGLPGGCPAGEPSGGIRFCGVTTEPVRIRESGGGTVLVRRICPQTSSAQDCFER